MDLFITGRERGAPRTCKSPLFPCLTFLRVVPISYSFIRFNEDYLVKEILSICLNIIIQNYLYFLGLPTLETFFLLDH